MSQTRAIGARDIIGVIPARWASKRFPGKMLAPIAKRPLLEWVIRGCARSRRVSRWVVATDDRRIAAVAERAGAEVAMTPTNVRSGSDRVALAVRHARVRWVVNWQGDEWLPDGRPIDRLVEALEAHPDCPVATLARPLGLAEAQNPNRVKVVLSSSGRALYFSRALIPYGPNGGTPVWLHLGAYAFSRPILRRFTGLSQTPLEKQEKLEQLRLLEHDIPVAVSQCRVMTFGIDTPFDAQTLERFILERRS